MATFNIRTHFYDLKSALSSLSPIALSFRVFWLSGPLILLVERTPADLWLTTIALTFLIRSFLIRDFIWLRAFWVKAAIAFWCVCILSSIMSADPWYSLTEALIWFRFPLFAAATAFWLANDRRLFYAMLISTLFGLIAMCFILSAELLIVGQSGSRLTWPYGDTVSGNYMAKVGMPAFVILVALAVGASSRLASISATIAMITMFFSLMTGERVNFLLRACSGMLAALTWRPKWKRYLGLIALEITALVVFFQAVPNSSYRFLESFLYQLPTNGLQSGYYRAMMPGVLAFQKEPMLGIGTGNLRNLCPTIIDGMEGLECHPHPHNFYIQLAGETGMIGLIAGTVFLSSIVWTCFSANRHRRDNVVFATAWVIPFGLFWPIATSADFFGQWNNIFMWSAVALALATVNLPRESEKNASA